MQEFDSYKAPPLTHPTHTTEQQGPYNKDYSSSKIFCLMMTANK